VTLPESRTCHTSDGEQLEAEYAAPSGAPRAAVLLCHPLPTHGGSMRSIVTSALFEALPGRGYAALRFNFRGVEGSSGSWGEGLAEPLDVVGALDTLVSDVGPHVPVAVVGWSFGADMTFSVVDPRIAAWEGIAAPLRFGSAYAVADDPRPKHLVLAAHDEFREPDSVIAEVAAWTNTTHEVITGASHFFVGRTDRVVDATDRFVSSIASS